MSDYKFLKILDKFKHIYLKLGVDYEKMRVILSMKLTLDSRRVSTVVSGGNVQSESKNSFNKALLLYAFMGIFTGIITLVPLNKMYTYTIVFSMFMFLILTIFISDFSTVLLDIRDRDIIGSRGIDNKTINAAKLTHICYYIFLTSMALSWLAIIGSFKSGIITGIVFLLALIIIDIFMVVITALLYLVILVYFDGEKVKDLINFIQIGLSVIMTVGYQFVGRMFEIVDINIIYESKIWNIFFPPMWFAAPIYALDGGKIDNVIITLILLGVIIPIIAITIYLKNTDRFEDSLSKLNLTKRNEKSKRKRIFYSMGKNICSNNEQKSAYELSSAILKRERELKLMTYPSLGFSLVFPLLFVFLFSMDDFTNLNNIPFEMSLNIYWFVFSIPTLMITMQYSNDYKSSWIYEAAFIKNKSNIYKGAYKALLFNILLPLYLVECAIFTVIFGVKVIPILIIVFITILVYIPIEHSVGENKIPFTVKMGEVDKSQSILSTIIGLAVLGGFLFISYFVLFNIYTLVAYGVVLSVGTFVLWKNCIKG